MLGLMFDNATRIFSSRFNNLFLVLHFIVTIAEKACSQKFDVENGKRKVVAFSTRLGYSFCMLNQKEATDKSVFLSLIFSKESAQRSLNSSLSVAVKSSSSSISAM